MAEAQAHIEDYFRRAIERGQRSGAFDSRIDAEVKARGLLASLIGFVVLSRSRPDRQLLQSILDEALQRLD